MALVFVKLDNLVLSTEFELELETSGKKLFTVAILHSVDKTELSFCTSPPTQHLSFFRNLPHIH